MDKGCLRRYFILLLLGGMTLARRKTCLKQITGQKKYLSLCLGYIVRTTNSSTPPLEVCEGFTHQRMVWMDKQKEKKKRGVKNSWMAFSRTCIYSSFQVPIQHWLQIALQLRPCAVFRVLSFSQASAATHRCGAQRAAGPPEHVVTLHTQTEETLLPCKGARISKDNT